MTAEQFAKITDDVERGRLSNIPECCIQFFVSIWFPLCVIRRRFDPKQVSAVSQMMAEYNCGGFLYVPCPHCRATGNRQTIIIHKPAKRKRAVRKITDKRKRVRSPRS